MSEFFGLKILDYWNDILSDLSELISHPSISNEVGGVHPYGDPSARALDCILAMAEKYGLETKNINYYAGHAEYGKGSENAVVMTHIDVVPEGEGWDSNPFKMTIRDGRAYGRGVCDNKGPAIVALHCLRALKDAGICGNRKLRVIFGCGEEIGMTDMKKYFASEQKPDMGFTPDATYGICNCEKGILQLRIRSDEISDLVKSFMSGTVVNAVPYKAECEILCDGNELESLTAMSDKSRFTITKSPDGAHILAKGVAAHGSTPELGENAAAYLVDLLARAFGHERLGPFFSFINEKIALTTNGSLLDVDFSDEPSGNLTFNMGIISSDSNGAALSVDIRHPVTITADDIIRKIRPQAENFGLHFEALHGADPLYLPADSKLIRILKGAYEDITGEKCTLFSMGGGTYARQMFGNGVAFGGEFPEQGDCNVHNCNEFIDLEYFKKHAQICLEAMYRMLTA